jgi:trigger factor
MDVHVKQLPKSMAEITVALSWEEWKKEIDHAAEHLASEMKVEGFRKGKIPRGMLEQRIGKNTLLVEGAEHAIDHTYPEALGKAKIVAIGKPEAHLGTVTEGESLSYSVVTAVLPKVTLTSWREAVKKKNAAEKGKKIVVDEKDIDEELRKVAESRAKYITVAREARDGDLIEVDFFVSQNGVPIEGGTSRKHPVVLGKGAFIPGFEEEVLGMKADEEKTFELTFPAAYHAKHLAGKPAEFRVKALLVQERDVPAIDDAFAKSLGAFENMEALRKSLSEGMLEEKRAKAKEDHRTVLLETVLEGAEAELPDVLVEGELDRMIREFESQASMSGVALDDFLAQAEKTIEGLRKEWAPQAGKRVLANLTIEELGEEEEIKVEQAEIEEEMNRALAYFKSIKQAEKDIDLPALYSASQTRIRNEKVFERLESL